jgi:hypothetical protein
VSASAPWCSVGLTADERKQVLALLKEVKDGD